VGSREDSSGQDQKQICTGQPRFHAQTGTCPASLPGWPCRFDPGHPLHRKSLHSKGFRALAGIPSVVKRGSSVPSGDVRTTATAGPFRQAGAVSRPGTSVQIRRTAVACTTTTPPPTHDFMTTVSQLHRRSGSWCGTTRSLATTLVWSKCGQDREAAPGEARSRPFDLRFCV
jgi:hypothetical protein